MDRRKFLRLLTIGGLALVSQGHAPYRQWIAYRRDHLMIVASRQRPDAFPLTKTISEDLDRAVPEARAKATRAPSVLHITCAIFRSTATLQRM